MEENNQTTISTTRVGLKYGLYTGAALVIYSFLLYTLRLDQDPLLGFLSTVIGISGVVYGIIEYKRGDNGYISFGQCFNIGMIVSVISGLFDAFFTLIYVKLINPTMLETLKNEMIKTYEAQKFSDEQIEQLMPFINWFTSSSGLFMMSILVTFIGGAILSLIIAAIMQKKKPLFD